MAGQQSVEDRAQAIDIRRRGERSLIPAYLLGRHVGRRSHGIAGVCQAALGLDLAGQAKVGDVWLAAFVQQDVCRFQIAVQDSTLVGVMDGIGNRRHQPGRGGDVGGEIAKLLVQAGAGYQLHAEKALAVLPADLVDGYDVRVVEPRDGLGLVLKPDQLSLAGEFGRPDDLQGNQPVQCDLPCPVDNAHPSPAQLIEQLITDGG